MNLSGRSVGQAVRFYKLEPSRHPGRLRRPEPARGQAADPARRAPTAARKGSATSPPTWAPTSFPGSGSASATRARLDAADYVLSRFRSPERAVIDDTLILATQAVAVWVTQGIDAAMNRFNGPAPSSGRSAADCQRPSCSCRPGTSTTWQLATEHTATAYSPNGGPALARQHLRRDVPARQHQGRRGLGRYRQARPRHPDQAQLGDRRQPPVGRAPARLPDRAATRRGRTC